ncbi:hypothetical protein BTO32_02275 [Marinobacter lutaoensis]|uniref:RND efflux pump membrane fusion protein barrel-sandwich domain-containing protein n=2 Tax=Marinobacter lutaoensis TaxID=135739 RepID=A0A1V2DYA3_9GAMM|nr:hypothetical protein BTO32_02275 [Marinobacter lutaoensis]
MQVRGRGKWLFWGLWGALALVAVGVALRPDPVWVDLAVVDRGPLEVVITEEGRTRVKDRYRVSAPVAGYLHRVALEVGDPVRAEDRLAQVDPLPSDILDARTRAESEARVNAAQAALMSARQQVEAAMADARLARQELDRLLALKDRDGGRFVSDEALSRARASEERAQAQLRSARFEADVRDHELAAARTRLEVSAARRPGQTVPERLDLRSPVAGAILAVIRKSEGIIQAGEPIVEVGNPEALEVVVDVLSYDAVQLRTGGEVRLRGWGGAPLVGVVRRVEPVGFEDISALGVEERRVQVVVDITSPAGLAAGARVVRHPDRQLEDGTRVRSR